MKLESEFVNEESKDVGYDTAALQFGFMCFTCAYAHIFI